MATEKSPNYTTAQEAIITAAVADAGGVANYELATTLAGDPRMNDEDGEARKPRSITAKMVRMGVPYDRKVAVRKDGTAVASKATIVAEIAKLVSGNLEGLDKAPRPALVALREALAA